LLHLAGAEEMLYIAGAGLLVQLPVVILKRKIFHRLFLRLVVTMAVVVALIISGFFYKLQIVTSHRTFDVAPITDVLSNNNAVKVLKNPSVITGGVQKCDWYIETYGTRPGYSVVYRALIRNYNNIDEVVIERDSVFGHKIDSTMMMTAVVAAQQSDKIRALFNYDPELFDPNDSMVESDILLMLGKKEQALQSLEVLLKRTTYPEFKQAVIDRINTLKTDTTTISL
jgi:hypothetical protein